MASNITAPVRLVCFDLGGVLVRICRTWAEGCTAACLPLRVDLTNGFPHISGWEDLGRQFGCGKIDGECWASNASHLLNGVYSPQEIRAIHDAWLLGEYEGVSEIIDQLHDRGLATAALSNTNADHWARLPQYPAFARLHHRLASHELGLLKPDTAIYRALEDRLGFCGQEILFFDDLSDNIAAAQAVGWRAVQIDPHRRTDEQIMSALKSHGVW